ncbi:hypothetical protein PHYSODRAFT_324744 [Phytophthora sojae]|uniref:Uncharacterized protein n=1 Tax=Phytophthora sojae (strain P6497) TaxID=1094619 RepID=G4YTF2_PHYSP|nr:hypothetical protein PHYSODRAFT_324744 [Phytophthora sojae]EGZ23551.1 hypothetical protein PHYSODRAFT_324744 [Phytophthora sojae]|eukprot:XP_009518839.1 hypothetical protein PHYSODRAFT_324744 [Phytophthora sojae]
MGRNGEILKPPLASDADLAPARAAAATSDLAPVLETYPQIPDDEVLVLHLMHMAVSLGHLFDNRSSC